MDKKGFIKYLEGKGHAQRTQSGCLIYLKTFFDRTEKEDIQVTKPDVLKYLEHLKNRGLQNITRQRHLTAINHYFTFLYKDGQIVGNPCLFLKIRGANKKTLYRIYTPEELEQLFDAYYQLFVRSYDNSRQRHDRQRHCSALSRERNALMLSILIYQGATTAEIDRIETADIDLMKATVKIRGGKKHNDRNLPLKASQIGMFMQYLQNTRPQFLEHHAMDRVGCPTG
jgi:integrase/recombinase XerD